MITKHGYIAETHHVWTEDGYRLELHRVLSKTQSHNSEIIQEINPELTQAKEESTSRLGPPILINHGLLSSSADWVLLGPQKALGNYNRNIFN